MTGANPIARAAGAAILALMICATPARATLDGTAGPFVDDLGNRAIDVFTDQSTSLKEKAERFRNLFREGFAVKALAAFTLGSYFADADDAFLDEFADVFGEYISLSYAARFNGLPGPVIAVVDVLPDLDSNGTEDGVKVTTHIEMPSGDSAEVDWRVREYRGKPIVVDVVVKGVSLAMTQQREFTAVIGRNGGDVRALLEVLKRKNEELREE